MSEILGVVWVLAVDGKVVSVHTTKSSAEFGWSAWQEEHLDIEPEDLPSHRITQHTIDDSDYAGDD